jgi:adenylate cyclase
MSGGPDATIDFEAEGLLDGLEGEARESRRELLENLAADGFSLDELRTAGAEGRLPLLPVERVLEGDGGRYTAAEVADRVDVDREFLERFWRALGMARSEPDEPVFTEADLEAARRMGVFRAAGLPDDQLIEITRVLSRTMATVASAVGTVFGDAFVEEGDNEPDLARRYAEASQALVPTLGPAIEHALNVQQRSLIRSNAVDQEALRTGRLAQGTEIAVCFADLVGFTRLGESVDAAELGAVAERLEELASQLSEPPVRLVKTIGDAVLLVSREPDPLIAAALALATAADDESERFPQVRVGMAYGEAIGRAGDWFGRPVNLASRITSIARPGTVLTDEALKEAATRDWSWSFAGKRRIRGIAGEHALFRVRAPSPNPQAPGPQN